MGMESARPASGEELLRHQAFVRRLAHELVRDAARADDLVQDAWVQALRHPPHVAAAARGWFRTVLRNLATRGVRDDDRRGERERSAAHAEVQPSPLEIGERIAAGQELLRAVEALREPYRSAIFQRYFEDLSPRAIAARENVPVATVKTRLRRALELLREALDRSGGGRRAWALTLVPLARTESTASLAGPLLAAGVVLAGVTAWVLRDAPAEQGAPGLAAAEPRSDTRTLPSEAALVAPADPSHALRGVAPQDEGQQEREPVRAPAATPEKESRAAERDQQDPLLLRGRVLFPDGSGAEGASVAFGPFLARCGRGGWFDMPLDEGDARASVRGRLVNTGGMVQVFWSGRAFEREDALVAWYDGWVPVIRGDFGVVVERALSRSPPSELEPVDLVLTGPSLEIRGTLLDRTGAPAEGWRFSLLDGELVARGDYRPFSAEDLASGTDSHQKTGVDGGFAFRGLTPEKSYRVRAWNERTLEQVVSEPIPAGTLDVLLRAPNEPWRAVVDGVVVGLDGTPLADVRCRLSMNEYQVGGSAWMTTGQEVTTDSLGRFAFVDVPPTEVFVRFNGFGSGTQLALPRAEPCRDLRIELARAGELHFEASPRWPKPDTVRVLDDAGERLTLEYDFGEGASHSTRDLPLSSPGTCDARVSERARWLVLLQGEQELVRLPLVIRYGEVTSVRW